jgi:NAD+ kinase
MLPIDLVLVRHGQSEENAAKTSSNAGDHSAYTHEFLERHTSNVRLTAHGRVQAAAAGAFLKKEFYSSGQVFDRHITSSYMRAMETAGLLDLPDADWFCDFYLSERDWGEFDYYPAHEHAEQFESELQRCAHEPFFFKPPQGESFAQLCLRVDRVLDTLHRECSSKRVIIVCHGEVMRAFQVRLERISKTDFKALLTSDNPADKIYNCQIEHYSRRNPETGSVMQYINWKRSIRPTEDPVWTRPWSKISRSHYTNEALLALVALSPNLVL